VTQLTGNDSPIPADDTSRDLTLAQPDDPALRHLGVVGDTYTILIAGADTGGRYALLDMLIPAGGGPPPHRHDFEEMFHVLEGRIELTMRGQTTSAGTGNTVNVPANAPHSFHNPTDSSVRLLCLVSPAGLEDFFAEFGDPVDSRTSPAPELSDEEQQQRMRKAAEAAPHYRIEML
jgi:quercetin dioxygenase-like cupin family protein